MMKVSNEFDSIERRNKKHIGLTDPLNAVTSHLRAFEIGGLFSK